MKNLLFILVVCLCFGCSEFSMFEEANCEEVIDAHKMLGLQCIVHEKYIDQEQHLYPTLEVSGIVNNNIVDDYQLLLLSDSSQVFEKIEAGDSLYKEEGNLHLVVFRNEEAQTFKFEFDCPEENLQ